jgi:hypothetical protein
MGGHYQRRWRTATGSYLQGQLPDCSNPWKASVGTVQLTIYLVARSEAGLCHTAHIVPLPVFAQHVDQGCPIAETKSKRREQEGE